MSYITDCTNADFIHEAERLREFGITYISYVAINDNSTFRFSTDESWLYETFIDKGLIESCPLRKTALLGVSRLIPWSSLTLEKNESMIMDARKDYNQLDGITLVNDFSGIKEVVAIATEKPTIKMEESYFSHMNNIKQIILNIRKIALLNSHSIRLSSGARSLELQT